MSPGLYSCVADQDPRFAMEVVRWVASLVDAAGVDVAHLVVHHIDEPDPALARWLAGQGITSRTIPAFAAGHPHCNKIGQLLPLAESGATGTVVLTDCDVAVVTDVRRLAAGPGQPSGKMVDGPNPPAGVISVIADAAAVAVAEWWPTDLRPDSSTLAGNFNGGVYLLDAADLAVLHERWDHWARWSIANAGLYGPHQRNIDQVSFALAVNDLDWRPVQLDRTCNYPLHKPEAGSGITCEPMVLHYHDQVTGAGFLRTSGWELVDRAVERANHAIETVVGPAGSLHELLRNPGDAAGLQVGPDSKQIPGESEASAPPCFAGLDGATVAGSGRGG